MKKLFFISLLFTFIALIALVYFVIPDKIVVRRTASLNAKQNAVFRSVTDHKNWGKWWPVANTNNENLNNNSYNLNRVQFSLVDILTSSIIIDIKTKKNTLKSSLDFLSFARDSILLTWNTELATTFNPVKRVQNYLIALEVKNDLDILLKKMQAYYSKVENTYGILIEEIPVVDSTLIFISDSSHGYPTSKFIYTLIDQLKNYSIKQGAQQSGFPMLNVYTIDSISYLVKVALPVNKKLKDEGLIKYKWMLGGGKILVCDITGENNKINYGLKQLEYYLRDYNRVAPAIPFISLITDRLKEPDSTKWKSRIYYPVM